METLKKLGDRVFWVVCCDTCGKICENGDYMGTRQEAMCVPCYNRIYRRKEVSDGQSSERKRR